MKNNTTIRQSNFELMRIISMIYIIIFHVMIHGEFLIDATGQMVYILMFLYSLIIIHVNSFILLTGYFQCEKELKLTKLISLNNTTWFYKVLFLVLVLITGIDLINPITSTDKIRTLLPIDYNIYWFINTYIILYAISPILNTVIRNVNKKQHFHILLVLFFLVSIIPTVTGDLAINTNLGRSIGVFILLYFIGAYIKKYPIEKNNFFSHFSVTKIRTISIFGYLFCAILGVMCFSLSGNLYGLGTVMQEVSKIFEMLYTSYGSPLVLLQVIFYFYIFKTLPFKNRVINYISKCVIGIYLIHENIYVRENLYRYLNVTDIKVKSIKDIGIIFIITIGLFLIGLIIEAVRQFIFKFIYNRKISNKFRKKYRNYFKNLGFDINW